MTDTSVCQQKYAIPWHVKRAHYDREVLRCIAPHLSEKLLPVSVRRNKKKKKGKWNRQDSDFILQARKDTRTPTRLRHEFFKQLRLNTFSFLDLEQPRKSSTIMIHEILALCNNIYLCKRPSRWKLSMKYKKPKLLHLTIKSPQQKYSSIYVILVSWGKSR